MSNLHMYLGMKWLLPGRILYGAFGGVYTLDDVKQALIEAGSMIQAEGQPPYTHIILNGTDVTEIQGNMLKLMEVGRTVQAGTRDPGVGWIITVDPDPHPVLYFVGSTIMQLAKARYRHIKTMDETAKFLATVDATLPAFPRWTAEDLRLPTRVGVADTPTS